MSKTTKNIIISVIVLVLLIVVGFAIFISTFSLFEEPERVEIKQECDYEGIRKAILFRINGNASSNPSIHVSIDNCKKQKTQSNELLVFTADKSNLENSDVKIKWTSFDTLIIEYNSQLRTFLKKDKVVYSDTTLNIVVDFKEVKYPPIAIISKTQ